MPGPPSDSPTPDGPGIPGTGPVQQVYNLPPQTVKDAYKQQGAGWTVGPLDLTTANPVDYAVQSFLNPAIVESITLTTLNLPAAYAGTARVVIYGTPNNNPGDPRQVASAVKVWPNSQDLVGGILPNGTLTISTRRVVNLTNWTFTVYVTNGGLASGQLVTYIAARELPSNANEDGFGDG
jgi:hypothetical protein